MQAETTELNYYIVFCTKYRKPVLTGQKEQRVRELFIESSQNYGFEIEKMEILPDHIHFFVTVQDSHLSPHRVISRLKGYSSRFMRKEFKDLKTGMPCMWTRSYYVGSIGHISEDTVKKYIENQKNV